MTALLAVILAVSPALPFVGWALWADRRQSRPSRVALSDRYCARCGEGVARDADGYAVGHPHCGAGRRA